MISAERATVAESPAQAGELDAQLRDYVERINESIRHAKKLSEDGVLTIGANTRNIIDHTRKYIDESGHVLKENFGEQVRLLTDYFDRTSALSKTQGETIEQVLALSENITKAGSAMGVIVSQSKYLALNARIESAHLGEQGKSFAIITDEMKALSTEIEGINRMVFDAAKTIRTCLPIILEQNVAQMRELETMNQTMTQIKSNIESVLDAASSDGNTHVSEILNLAYASLSALQFQDPMIQSVQKIHFIVKELYGKLNSGTGAEIAIDSDDKYVATIGDGMETDPDASADAPAAGDVILF